MADYYVVRKRQLNINALFTMDPGGEYYYTHGWNQRAFIAVGVAAVFSIAAVWMPALATLSGFAWILGAALGGVIYIAAMSSYEMPEAMSDVKNLAL